METPLPPFNVPAPPPGSDVDLRVDDAGLTVRFHAPPWPGWVRPVLATGAVLLCGSTLGMIFLAGSPGTDQWMPLLYVNGLLGAGLLVAGAANVFLRPSPQRLALRVDRERLSVHEPWRLEGARGSWPKRDVIDLCVAPVAQVLAEAPQMELRLRFVSSPTVYLLAGRNAVELMWLADVLRRLLDLPARREHRAHWLRGRAPTAPPSVPRAAPAGAVAALPVLAYAAPRTASRALDPFVRYAGGAMTVSLQPAAAPAPAVLTLTTDELVLDDGGVTRSWRCDDVYAVFTSFAAEGEPAELFICWADAPGNDGVDRVLATVPESQLRRLADLLNEAMGLRTF